MKPKPTNISDAQNTYLRKQLYTDRIIKLMRILLFVGFIALWEVSAVCGWIDDFIFCSPSQILQTFIEMCANGSIAKHTLVTLSETLISFSMVILIGVVCAVILWASKTVSRILEPYLVVLNSLPKSALAPVLIVWLGSNPKTIIVTAVSVAVFGTIINVYTSFTEIDPEKIRLIQTLGGSRTDILTKLILPCSLPILMSTMKVNIGLSLVGVIIGEFLAARSGLGFLIIYGSQTFKMSWVLLSIVILCLIAMLLYKIINCLEKWYLRGSSYSH